LFPPHSVNHKALSGPVTMLNGRQFGVGISNSVMDWHTLIEGPIHSKAEVASGIQQILIGELRVARHSEPGKLVES